MSRLTGRILAAIGLGLGAIALLLVLAALLLDTSAGHRFLAARLSGASVSGLRLQIGEISGTIFGRLRLSDLTLRDAHGVVATSPQVIVDWRPAALLRREVDIGEISSERVRLLRQPVLQRGGGKSRVPALSYRLGRLQVTTLILEPPLAGERRELTLGAAGEWLRGRRLALQARARARDLPGRPGGDVAVIDLDAEPRVNRLSLTAHLTGPAGGVLDRLLNLDAAVAVDVSGRGDWRDWRGQAGARIGEAQILDAKLAARNGRFSAVGAAAPGRLVKSLAALTRPALRFDVAATVRDQTVAVQGRAASGVLSLQARGAIERRQRRFDDLRIQIALLDPSALSPKLGGRDVRLDLRLDGPFARPVVDYDAQAQALAYGGFGLAGVSAHGRSVRVGDGSVEIPVSLTAARVTGRGKSAEPLRDVNLAGPVVIRGDGQVAADLTIRSRQLQATLHLAGSQRSGRYLGTLQAKLGANAVDHLGLGSVLGGGASFSAALSRSPQTLLAVSNLQLNAPLLHIRAGEASYGAAGQIRLALSAETPQTGPVELTASGALPALRAHLAAPAPNLPAPLSQLQADLTSIPGGYQITARAASAYGPVVVDAVARTAARPLTLVLQRAEFGGLSASGALTRTPAGPFAGALTLSGDGLDGAVRLSAQGAAQAVDAHLRARNARLPLAPPLFIRDGALSAAAVLRAGGPEIRGRVRAFGVQHAGLTLTRLQAQGSYGSGGGRASLDLAGETGTSFQLTADAALTPEEVRLTGSGAVAGVRLRLAAPAILTREAAAWRLSPTTVLTSGGRLVISGTYGQERSLSAQLQSVDLRLLRAVRPGLGLSGRASGVAQLSLPKTGPAAGRLEMEVTGLTHTGATTVSEPLDLTLLAELAPRTAEARAVVRDRGAVIGRVQAHLALPPTGALAERLQAAQLSGGLRYNGPGDILVGLAGAAGQQLSGPIAIGADVSGPLQHPQLNGIISGRNLDYQDAAFGTHVSGIELRGRFIGPRLQIDTLTGSTPGGGRITAAGYADLSPASGWPVHLTATLDRAQIAQSDQLGARLSGTLQITNSRPRGALISGDLRLDSARYQAEHRAAAETAELTGVHWKGQPVAREPAQAAGGPPSRWRLDVHVHAPNQILVNGMGLTSEWRADLTVTGDISAPRLVGDVRSVRGTYSFGGRRLTLADSVIHFTGASPPNPTLDISASADVKGVTASVVVGGSARRPQIHFTSSPALPEDEVLSQLLFGGPSAQISSLQALQLAASLQALRGGGVGALGKLSQATGLQNLRIQGPNSATEQGVSVGAGAYITNNIYVDVLTDARGYTATRIEVALTPVLSLLSQISTFGATSASVRYTHRY